MAFCYILFSRQLSKFYIGATQDSVIGRIEKHIESFYGSTFTSQAKDWELFLEIQCSSFAMAVNIERHLKKMKSKIYLQNLKKHPDMIDKLKNKYKSI
jgi:putative endonuclease